MQKLFSFLEKYFVPIAGKIGAQRHLAAVRDGFVAIMPLMLLGSLAVLVNNIPIDAYQEFMKNVFGESWTTFGGKIWDGSFAIIGLLVSVTVAYNLAKSYNVDGLSAGIISLGSYIILTPQTADWGVAFAWIGAQGLFVALLTALITTEIFRFLIQRKITIKMPAGVPDAVSRSFAALIPAFFVFVVVVAIQLIFKANGTSAAEFIFNWIQQPLQNMSNTLVSAIVVAVLIHVLWFFGLHGTNILGPIMETVYLPSIEQNIQLFKDGVEATSDQMITVTKVFFDVFVHMGGAGTTLALIVAIFLVAKSQQYRGIGKLTAPAGLFNINEPVLYGVPIVLNPVLLVPFILTPVVLTIVTYFAMNFGFVPKTVAMVPWTMPPIFSGYLATGGSISGVILQVFNFGLAVLMYIPFITVADRAAKKAETNN